MAMLTAFYYCYYYYFRFVTKEVTEKLFTEDPQDKNKKGTDLVTLNIMRGREHGIAGWSTLPYSNLVIEVTIAF